MTTQHCAAVLRVFLFMALIVGFFGFLSGAPGTTMTSGGTPSVQLSLSPR